MKEIVEQLKLSNDLRADLLKVADAYRKQLSVLEVLSLSTIGQKEIEAFVDTFVEELEELGAYDAILSACCAEGVPKRAGKFIRHWAEKNRSKIEVYCDGV